MASFTNCGTILIIEEEESRPLGVGCSVWLGLELGLHLWPLEKQYRGNA